MKPIVELQNVSKTFGDVTALRDITQTVAAGELVGIIGPNGGGKSTLLNLVAGLIVPTDGTITIGGIPAHELARQSAGTIGLVTANPGLYPLLTGAENLAYFAGLFGLDPDTIASRSQPLVDLFDLGPAMSQRVRTWSTGMRQRLSLIRALITEPDLLLFDEPTANLDPIGEHELHLKLREKADDGLACLLVTHRLEQAQAICDRVWYVDKTIVDEVALDPGQHQLPSGPLFDMWKKTP
jgi:ABC-2 type transport system ATP-binding protein